MAYYHQKLRMMSSGETTLYVCHKTNPGTYFTITIRTCFLQQRNHSRKTMIQWFERRVIHAPKMLPS